MSTNLLQDALKLTPRERLELIGALWDTLSETDIPVTAEEKAILDSRLAEADAQPDDQSSWEEVRARLEKRHR